MVLREQDKHFLWSLYFGVAVILFWKGIWEGIGGLPIIESPWVSLFIGLAMLTFSGLIYREFDPLGNLESSIQKVMQDLHHHPQKHEFEVKYQDKSLNKTVTIKASKLNVIEKNTLVFKEDNGQERFIPIHRVTEILRLGKTHWKL